MTKILVFSDTHGEGGKMNDVINNHPDARIILHAGDGYSELMRVSMYHSGRIFCGVTGNSDPNYGPDAKIWDTLNLYPVTIFLAHGHTFDIYRGRQRIMYAALQQNAHICIHGHTHIPYIQNVEGLYMMNPGSLERPRSADGIPTYGIIEIDGENISMRIEQYTGG